MPSQVKGVRLRTLWRRPSWVRIPLPALFFSSLRVCGPAIFIMHEQVGVDQDYIDPQMWGIAPVWLSLCTRCMKCVEACSKKAITVD